jgi:hypothetical protein
MSLSLYRLDSFSKSVRMSLRCDSIDSTTTALRRLSSVERGPSSPALIAHSVSRNSCILRRHSNELPDFPMFCASESSMRPFTHPPSNCNASEAVPSAVPGSMVEGYRCLVYRSILADVKVQKGAQNVDNSITPQRAPK